MHADPSTLFLSLSLNNLCVQKAKLPPDGSGGGIEVRPSFALKAGGFAAVDQQKRQNLPQGKSYKTRMIKKTLNPGALWCAMQLRIYAYAVLCIRSSSLVFCKWWSVSHRIPPYPWI